MYTSKITFPLNIYFVTLVTASGKTNRICPRLCQGRKLMEKGKHLWTKLRGARGGGDRKPGERVLEVGGSHHCPTHSPFPARSPCFGAVPRSPNWGHVAPTRASWLIKIRQPVVRSRKTLYLEQKQQQQQ